MLVAHARRIDEEYSNTFLGPRMGISSGLDLEDVRHAGEMGLI
jgi:hypothetical protein